MRKLRVVTDLDTGTSVEQSEIDELINSGLIKNQSPWVFLAVKGDMKNQLNSAMVELGIDYKKSFNPEIRHYFVCGDEKTHREKTLVLLGLATVVLEKNPEAACLLGDLSTLKFVMSNQETLADIEDRSMSYKNWHPQKGECTLTTATSVWLQDVAIEAATTHEYIGFTKDEILSQWKKLNELHKKSSHANVA